MKLNREALRAANKRGPLAVVQCVNNFGYKRGIFDNGFEAIVTPDGNDWINLPQFSMREAEGFYREWLKVPSVDMGR